MRKILALKKIFRFTYSLETNKNGVVPSYISTYVVELNGLLSIGENRKIYFPDFNSFRKALRAMKIR